MSAYELCQRNVVKVLGHEDLATAAWIMRERNVGCLVESRWRTPAAGWWQSWRWMTSSNM